VTSPSFSPRLAASLLTALLVAASLLCDLKVANAMLTLPLVVAGLISWAVTAWGVPHLRNLKLGQVIREEGPQGHQSKAGTPTMGGLLVVPVGVIVGALISPADPRLLAVAAVTLAYMAVGSPPPSQPPRPAQAKNSRAAPAWSSSLPRGVRPVLVPLVRLRQSSKAPIAR